MYLLRCPQLPPVQEQLRGAEKQPHVLDPHSVSRILDPHSVYCMWSLCCPGHGRDGTADSVRHNHRQHTARRPVESSGCCTLVTALGAAARFYQGTGSGEITNQEQKPPYTLCTVHCNFLLITNQLNLVPPESKQKAIHILEGLHYYVQ